MTTSKATVGPYRRNGRSIDDAKGATVALLPGRPSDDANARLLAASWEMRDLLQSVADTDCPFPVRQAARALLARIDGGE